MTTRDETDVVAEPLLMNLRGSFVENAFSVEAVDAAVAEDIRAGVAGCVFLGTEGAVLPKTGGRSE